jgi:hypothetical protein
MVLTCNLGCVGQGATAIDPVPQKRFLASLACAMCRPVPLVYIERVACACAWLYIVSRLWIGSATM